MRLLLDTRAYLWWLTDDPRLSDRARKVVSDPSSVVHVSAASLWEIAVKVDLGRLQVFSGSLVEEVQAGGFVELPVTARHGWLAGHLPPHPEGPVGALLAAQAMIEELVIANPGGGLAVYDVTIL